MASNRRLLIALLALTAAGCAFERTVVDASVVDTHGSEEAELDFWEGLESRRVVTNDDALYGLLLLAGSERAHDGYTARVVEARARGWLAGHEEPPSRESATVGLISVAVCEILEIRGGVTMQLLGPSPRYCTRELVFMQLIPRRTENQSLTGLEFLDLVGRVDDMVQARAS